MKCLGKNSGGNENKRVAGLRALSVLPAELLERHGLLLESLLTKYENSWQTCTETLGVLGVFRPSALAAHVIAAVVAFVNNQNSLVRQAAEPLLVKVAQSPEGAAALAADGRLRKIIEALSQRSSKLDLRVAFHMLKLLRPAAVEPFLELALSALDWCDRDALCLETALSVFKRLDANGITSHLQSFVQKLASGQAKVQKMAIRALAKVAAAGPERLVPLEAHIFALAGADENSTREAALSAAGLLPKPTLAR